MVRDGPRMTEGVAVKPSIRLLVLASVTAASFLIACLPAEELAPTTTPGAGTEAPPASPAPRTRSTPVRLTPVPAAAERPDCTTGWAAYEDPDGYFSLCYPADWFATSAPPQAYFGHTFSLRSRDESRDLTDSMQMVVYWQEVSAWDAVGASGPCSTEVLLEDADEVAMTLAGRVVTACIGTPLDTEGDDPGPPFYLRTVAEVPLAAGTGHVRVSYSQREDIGPSHAAALAGILESLQIEE